MSYFLPDPDDYPGDSDWSECGDGHDEIIYYCQDCPLCAASKKIEELEDRIFELEGTPNDQTEQKP